jgi:hypothetical protein
MADIVDYFTRPDVVRIATERKSGDEVVTPIWDVVVHGVAYIAVNSEVDRVHEAKYAGQGQPLREVVSPEVRRFTMRLTPRG